MTTAVSIGLKSIGEGHPCLIAFEPGATFQSAEEAQELLKAVADSGADAVKFQTFLPGDAERMMGDRKDIPVRFGTERGEKQESVFGALCRRELPAEEWRALVEAAHEKGLLFITAPYFFETVEFLKEVGVDAVKISKGDINNVLLIEAVAKTGLPVVLDGREKSEDLKRAVEICEKYDNRSIVVMHCPGGYPAKDHNVHLKAIPRLKEQYGYPVGFADHSRGTLMNYAALALGADMLEKTITPEKTREQVEHSMSLEPSQLSEFVENIRSLEAAMGSADVLSASRVEETARRSLMAKRSIAKSQEITEDMLDFQRPGDAGISVSKAYSVLGKQAKAAIPPGTFLQWKHLRQPMEECVVIRKQDVEKALSAAPVAGKRALEPIKSMAEGKGLPFAVLEDHKVPQGIPEVHLTKADLFLCLEGNVRFIYGGTLVDSKQVEGSEEDLVGESIEGGHDVVLGPGDWLWIPANQPHLHATPGTARLVVIKVPMT